MPRKAPPPARSSIALKAHGRSVSRLTVGEILLGAASVRMRSKLRTGALRVKNRIKQCEKEKERR